jgi:hypothetical protein
MGLLSRKLNVCVESATTEHPDISPASWAGSSLAFHRLNTSENFSILRSCSQVGLFMIRVLTEAENPTTRVLPNPDNSRAADTPAGREVTLDTEAGKVSNRDFGEQ